MGFAVSPSVTIKEVDISGYVSPSASAYGATVGVANWGPVAFPYELANESELVSVFGKPDNTTANSFFTSANFLSYSNSLKFVRAQTTNMANACTTPWVALSGNVTGTQGSGTISGTSTAFDTQLVVGQKVRFMVGTTLTEFTVESIASASSMVVSPTLAAAVNNATFERWQKFQIFGEHTYELMSGTDLDNGGVFAARFPGEMGNSLSISIADKYTYERTLTGTVSAGVIALTGTCSTTSGTKTITGSGTKFLSEVKPGATVTIENGASDIVAIIESVASDTSMTATVNIGATVATATATVANGANVLVGAGTDFVNGTVVGDILTFTSAGVQYVANVISITNANILTIDTNVTGNVSGLEVTAKWAFADAFDGAPGTSEVAYNLNANADDEIHVVIYDQDGLISGTPGLVLERFPFCSKAGNGKKTDGTSSFYKNVINRNSKYMWWLAHPTDATGASMDETGRQAWGSDISPTVSFYKMNRPVKYDLIGGQAASSTVTDAFLMAGYDLLANDEKYDVSLIVTGKASPAVINYAIQTVAEVRKDCVVFASPYDKDTGEFIVGDTDVEIQKLIEFRNLLPSSSYAMLDSGAKYQYDRYNDIYRWIPLNGDIAGLCARVDNIADPWFSPGGFNRGQVKNVAKLGINPNRTQRDKTYKVNINCVVNFPGEGPVLYGDKTLQTKPSAFDRINVRRLFIVMEKAIATAAKYQLFELNDTFTRAQFKSMIEPFLRDIQGRRGVYDFRVVCDETNNTPEIIDRNEFVASIFVKPAKSINFITLNFVSVRTGTSFEEVAGAV